MRRIRLQPDPVEQLIGSPDDSEQYPWLNQRQVLRRQYKESAVLYDSVVTDTSRHVTSPTYLVDAYEQVDLKLYLEGVIVRARTHYGLRNDEEQCFRLHESLSMTVEEIGEQLSLGPKTVRRRIASALAKLINAASDSPSTDGSIRGR